MQVGSSGSAVLTLLFFFFSELLLGPVPTNFTFLPKHKANSYR